MTIKTWLRRAGIGLFAAAATLASGAVLAQGAPDSLLSNPDVRRVYLGEAFRL